MTIDAGFFTILIFIILNVIILFTVKTRTTLVISLIISHLIIVLFLSISIANYTSFKEISLGLIIYSMVVLFLISNYNLDSVKQEEDRYEKRTKSIPVFFVAFIVVIMLISFLFVFKLAKNLPEISKTFANNSQKIQISDSLKSKSNIEIRKTYRLQRDLSNNFLLKRSSDMILIISSLIAIYLLFITKEKDS